MEHRVVTEEEHGIQFDSCSYSFLSCLNCSFSMPLLFRVKIYGELRPHLEDVSTHMIVSVPSR